MMEIQSISFDNKTLSIFCNIKDKDDLKNMAFILSAFASGYFCTELSPQEILETLEELIKVRFSNDILHKFLIQMIYTKEGLALRQRTVAKYKVVEERKLKLISSLNK